MISYWVRWKSLDLKEPMPELILGLAVEQESIIETRWCI